MPATNRTSLYHSNNYSAGASCEHCGGVVRHQKWCTTINPTVSYAYEAVLDSAKLSVRDQLILHALGVVWSGEISCGPDQTTATA